MIPNIAHFIFSTSPKFGGKPFGLSHYLAIKSLDVLNKPEKIFFHYQNEPEGEWWEKIRPLLTLNRIELPETVYGKPLLHMAHQADVVRLDALYETGGIYLDLDTISVKSYLPLLQNNFVMGLQYWGPVFYDQRDKVAYNIKKTLLRPFVKLPSPSIRGLANTIILASPKNKFIDIWRKEYKNFRGGLEDLYWDEHAVRVPYAIAKKHPELITIIKPESFYLPAFDRKGLRLMFEKVHSFPDAIIHHLWQNVSWEKYGKDLTPEKIRTIDTTYNLIARKYL